MGSPSCAVGGGIWSPLGLEDGLWLTEPRRCPGHTDREQCSVVSFSLLLLSQREDKKGRMTKRGEEALPAPCLSEGSEDCM